MFLFFFSCKIEKNYQPICSTYTDHIEITDPLLKTINNRAVRVDSLQRLNKLEFVGVVSNKVLCQTILSTFNTSTKKKTPSDLSLTVVNIVLHSQSLVYTPKKKNNQHWWESVGMREKHGAESVSAHSDSGWDQRKWKQHSTWWNWLTYCMTKINIYFKRYTFKKKKRTQPSFHFTT